MMVRQALPPSTDPHYFRIRGLVVQVAAVCAAHSSRITPPCPPRDTATTRTCSGCRYICFVRGLCGPSVPTCHGHYHDKVTNVYSRISLANSQLEDSVNAEDRPWMGNGPDPYIELHEEEKAAVGATTGVGEYAGSASHEVWMNGPFQAHVSQGPVDILHLDDDIVVANKPSGLLCVPGRLEKDSLATRVALELNHYRVDKMIVHRLDMATSGVVVMARSDAALKSLHRQFRERMVRKTYVAIVHGVLPAEEGEVDLPLCRNRGCPPLHMVNFEMGKPSLTEWRVIGRAADRTRVELVPVSGRSHQLRLHMDAIGHPILGDHFYGTKESLALANRCLLHAQTLSIEHPATGEPITFNACCEF